MSANSSLPSIEPASHDQKTRSNSQAVSFQSRMDGLPVELSNMIYGYTFTPSSHTTIRVSSRALSPKEVNDMDERTERWCQRAPHLSREDSRPLPNTLVPVQPTPSLPTNLMSVNKDSRAMFTASFFASTIFILDNPALCHNWMNRMPNTVHALLKEVRVCKKPVAFKAPVPEAQLTKAERLMRCLEAVYWRVKGEAEVMQLKWESASLANVKIVFGWEDTAVEEESPTGKT